MHHRVQVTGPCRLKCEELLADPVIVKVTDFTPAAAQGFSLAFGMAHSTGQSIIPVVIDSYGGQVYSLLSMISVIEKSKLPVATIGMGKVMSCGAALLTCGAEGHRYMDENATVMIHEVSGFALGKIEEVKVHAKEIERLNTLVFRKMAKNCGHEADYFSGLVGSNKHADWYLDATEAKAHNLVNHIDIPVFTTKISVNVEFGVCRDFQGTSSRTPQ